MDNAQGSPQAQDIRMCDNPILHGSHVWTSLYDEAGTFPFYCAGTKVPDDYQSTLLKVDFVRLHPDATPPSRFHPHDAGADLYSYLPDGHAKIEPREAVGIATGIALSIPEGYVGLVHPRSGLAIHQGLTVLNAPGTIDSGYTGQVIVLLYNAGRTAQLIAHGTRIAQLVMQRVELPAFREVVELEATHRGEGGFGSTGR